MEKHRKKLSGVVQFQYSRRLLAYNFPESEFRRSHFNGMSQKLKTCARSSNDSPSKTIKNVSYFIEKPLFVPKVFNFL